MPYRNSQLKLRRQCGYAYGQEYIHEAPGAPSPALRGGQNVHEAVAEAVRRVVAGDPFLDIHDVAFRAVRGGDAEYADALRVLTRFQEALGTEFEIDAKAAFLVEEELRMPIQMPDGTEEEYFGTPDLGQRIGKTTALIDDWKTHWSPMTAEQCEADPQLQRYALLVHHHFPAFERFILVRRFIRYENNFHRQEITVDELPRVRDALASEIYATRELDEAEDFQATPGTWCALCGHHATCPRLQQLRDAGVTDVAVPDDEAAERIAADLVVLEAARARLQLPLRRYLGEPHPRGTVPVGAGEYGYHSTTHRAASPADVREILADQGIQMPDELLSFDLQAWDRWTQKLPESAVKAVESRAIRTSEGARFQYRRAPERSTTTETTTPATEPGELFE